MSGLLRAGVAAAWLTLGFGFVPVLALLALGVVVWVPLPEVGRHLLRLARRAASPLGTRVCDRQGRGVLRLLPLIGGALAADAVVSAVDPDGLLEDDTPGPAREDAEPLDGEGLLEGALGIAWFLAFGWELALVHLVLGVVLCLTLVGAVFGVRHLALVPVALYPPGFHILRAGEPLPRPPRFALRGRDGVTPAPPAA